MPGIFHRFLTDVLRSSINTFLSVFSSVFSTGLVCLLVVFDAGVFLFGGVVERVRDETVLCALL
jgi:glucokinase